jgi:hypothetical protein
MSNPYTRERIENWVSDFCMSDDVRPFSPALRQLAGDVLLQFVVAACDHRGIEPEDLEEQDVKHGLIGCVARLNIEPETKKDCPNLCAALLDHLQNAGRLGGGHALAAYARALQTAFDQATSGKTAPVVRPGSKIGRNDPCPCGSGLKYKKCCMNG